MRGWIPVTAVAALLFACAFPGAASAQGVSLGDFVFGFEAGVVRQDIGGATLLSGVVEEGGATLNGSIENRVADTKLSRGMARVTYQASPIASPYVLLGPARLSFDDTYRLESNAMTSPVEQTVEFADSAVAVGIGAEGKLAKLPASLTLGYGVRFLGFKVSDTGDVRIEDVSQFEDADIATDVSYAEWSVAVTVSREILLGGNLVLTPYGGLRHTSVHMNASTEMTYRPFVENQPVAISGSFERSLDGNLNSAVVGCAAALGGRLTGYAQFVGIGETGVEMGVGYRF